MHYDACQRVSAELIEASLIDEIGRLKTLTAGASAAGATVHNLPKRPNDIEDDGEFHFAILGPRAVSDSGKPNVEAKRYIEETTGPDKPRVFRNAIVLAVPSRDGIEAARNRIRDYLGWEEVRAQLKGQELDPIRDGTLSASISGGRARITEAIQQAYSVVVTVAEKNDIQAFKITVDGPSLFARIKEDKRARIQDSAVSAEALLPSGPYDLWREGEKFRRLKDLVGAFALSPQLPKMLNRRAIIDTLVIGCKEGQFVLRAVRPDRSVRTFWCQEPDEAVLKDPSLEVVLPEAAELSELTADLVVPGQLAGLWESESASFANIAKYFSGGTVLKIKKDGYDEPVTIPKAARELVEASVAEAVRQGKLWLTSGQASILSEEIPAGLLTDDARFQPPPQPIPAADVTPSNLPEVWSGETTTALAIAVALSKKAGTNLPWATVRQALDGAIRARMLETAIDSTTWPCDYVAAQNVKLRVPKALSSPPPPPPPNVLIAEAELKPNEIQDFAEQLPDIRKATGNLDLKLHLRLELDGREKSPAKDMVAKLNDLLTKVSKGLSFE